MLGPCPGQGQGHCAKNKNHMGHEKETKNHCKPSSVALFITAGIPAVPV